MRHNEREIEKVWPCRDDNEIGRSQVDRHHPLLSPSKHPLTHPHAQKQGDRYICSQAAGESPITAGCSINLRANYVRNELTVMRPRPRHRARCSNQPPPIHTLLPFKPPSLPPPCERPVTN